MDDWKTILSFWDGQFLGAYMLVSGSVLKDLRDFQPVAERSINQSIQLMFQKRSHDRLKLETHAWRVKYDDHFWPYCSDLSSTSIHWCWDMLSQIWYVLYLSISIIFGHPPFKFVAVNDQLGACAATRKQILLTCPKTGNKKEHPIQFKLFCCVTHKNHVRYIYLYKLGSFLWQSVGKYTNLMHPSWVIIRIVSTSICPMRMSQEVRINGLV